MRKLLKFAGVLFGLAAIAVFAAWATSPDPTGNPASFEDAPLVPELSPRAEALTLAQYELEYGGAATMLVTGLDAESVTGIDLVDLGAQRMGDPLRDLASLPPDAVSDAEIAGLPTVVRPWSALLPAAPSGDRHIGTGTNFPEHAEEASSEAVFRFPKFGRATPANAAVQAKPGILLDYEVELCMRFDRDIASLEDFDAAVKGLFLCGDFTNRNALVDLADPDNLDSGYGFSDAKSGPDFFPSGGLLVVPRDWKSFVERVRMTTSVNGDPRQDARGAEMTLDFRALAQGALADMDKPRFLYQGGFYRLSGSGKIGRDMTLMSGTSEGVIFTPPSRADYIEGILAYGLAGGPLAPDGLVDTVKQRFIANELASGHFLQPGDIVRHESDRLGTIEVRVVAP
jgi:2-keto-4-pentenoate hydratase/2-oxohepta-3-ene-1,7-dioic acid hydratase in catechol pathway